MAAAVAEVARMRVEVPAAREASAVKAAASEATAAREVVGGVKAAAREAAAAAR